MKKLLITTMAAASLAFCAKAADEDFISGINFESYTTEGTALSFSEESDGNVYWSTDSKDGLFVVSNLNSFASTYPTSRPAHWADDASNDMALFIDSDKPLMRNVNGKDADGSFPAESLADGDLFFDSVVQFTATDTAPEIDYKAGDKLIAWLYISEDATTDNPGDFGETAPVTNLVITSGTRETGSLASTNYYTNIAIEPDSWHRLTIKSFMEGGRVYFNVYVDGTPVTSGEVTNFLSLTEPGSQTEDVSVTGTTVTGVAFDGKGAVDDLVFTTTDPFAGASYAVTVKLAETDDASGLSAETPKYYSVDGGEFVAIDETAIFAEAGLALTLPVDAQKITFKIGIWDGGKLDGGTAGDYAEDGSVLWVKDVNVSDIVGDGTSGTVALSVVIDDGTVTTTYGATVDYNETMVKVSGNSATYAAGAPVAIVVEALTGYEVTAVTVAGATTAPPVTVDGTTYEFTMPAEAVTITVTAQAKSYELTLTAANATVTGVETGKYAYNSKISFKVEVASDYTLKGVTMNDNALTAGDDGSYTFTMPAADVALVVTTEKTQEAAKPTVNGTAATDADDFKAAAKSGSTITLPTGWELNTETGVITDADGNTYATFESYYTATPGEDGTSFTVAFNDTAKPEVGDSTAGDAIAVTTDTVTLGITNAKKDLYYTVKAYSDVACTKALGAGDSVQADEDGVLSISITKPAEVDAAFFKVQVTDKEVETTEAGTEE